MSRAPKLNSRRAARKIRTLLKRDGNLCWLCGGTFDFDLPRKHPYAVSLDHIVPVSQGGRNHNDNLALAHRRCNIQRGAKEAA